MGGGPPHIRFSRNKKGRAVVVENRKLYCFLFYEVALYAMHLSFSVFKRKRVSEGREDGS